MRERAEGVARFLQDRPKRPDFLVGKYPIPACLVSARIADADAWIDGQAILAKAPVKERLEVGKSPVGRDGIAAFGHPGEHFA